MGIPVSEHLFAWRTTTTARLTDYAEAMGIPGRKSGVSSSFLPEKMNRHRITRAAGDIRRLFAENGVLPA